MKLVLIGQAPGRGDGGPLEGRIGKRLAALFGLDGEKYLLETERHNVFPLWPGKNGKGDAFLLKKARAQAHLMFMWLNGRHVLFLGKNVAKAFGFDGERYFEWSECWSIGGSSKLVAAIIPHPSGVNRWWNEKRNVRKARKFLRAALAKAL